MFEALHSFSRALRNRLDRRWLALPLSLLGFIALLAVFAVYQHPSFPFVDWLRFQSLEAPRSFMLGLLAVLLCFRAALASSGWLRWPMRTAVLLGSLGVLFNMLTPQFFHGNILDQEGPGVLVPVVREGQLVSLHWRTDLLKGSPLLLLPRLIHNQSLLSDIAQGIHQQRSDQALALGEQSPGQYQRFNIARRLLWTIQKALAALSMALRGLLLPMFVYFPIRVLLPGRPSRRTESLLLWALRSMSLFLPVFNLAFLAALATLGLPDGLSQRSHALFTTLLFLAAVLAVDLAGRFLAFEPASGAEDGTRRPSSATSGLLLVLAGGMACGVQDSPQGSAPASSPAHVAVQVSRDSALPDLLLLLVPGLRADPPATPGAEAAFFAGLAPSPGVRFLSAYAQSCHPFTSLGSLLAGRYPSAIPLCSLYQEQDQERREAPWCSHMPSDTMTLPQVLALYGYHTALFSADFPGAELLAPLFQHWDGGEELWTATGTDWDELARRAGSWFDEQDGPRFLVVVTMDLQLDRRPDLLKAMDLDKGEIPYLPGIDSEPLSLRKIGEMYSGAAMEAGRGVALLLDGLESRPGTLRTFVTSTNGVNLGEWHWDGDTRPLELVLLEGTIHVPLAILGSSSSGVSGVSRKTDRVVELADIFPTITAMVGATPPSGTHGHDLMHPAEHALPTGTAYAEFGDMLALRMQDYLLLFRGFLHGRSSLDPELTERLAELVTSPPGLARARYHLYDVVRDPFQQRDLAAQQALKASYLLQRLMEYRRGLAAPAGQAMDPQRLWDLRLSPTEGYW